MKALKRISAAAVALTLMSSNALAAEYKLGNVKQFYSFEDYSALYSGSNKTYPNGFIYVSNTFAGRKGYYFDKDRYSKAFKVDGFNTETFLKFGKIVDSGKLHLSFDLYQYYDSANVLSKGKTMLVMLGTNPTATYNEGWYHGEVVKNAQVYNQYDPEAIVYGSGFQNILNMGRITDFGDDETKPIPNAKGGIMYYNEARSWGANEAFDPNRVIDWNNWYKLDLFFDKDNNTYEVYLDGELVEGKRYVNGEYTDSLAPTLNSTDAYKAIKGVFFRTKTAELMKNGSQQSFWHTSNNGGFLLDNVYAKSYTGDNDIISLVSDDSSGNGVAVDGGKLSVAYSEYMDGAASKENIEIKNVLTGAKVENFELVNSDNMQFVIEFGDTLEPGKYSVNVSGLKGKISGGRVAVPVYFDTVSQNRAWVNDVKALRSDGMAQERGVKVTSGTTAVAVEFTEAVSLTDENAADYLRLESNGQTAEIESCKVSEDGKTVNIYPKYLFEPGAEYTLTVSGGVSTQSGNEFLTNSNGNILEEKIEINDDPLCEYSHTLNYDEENRKASFEVDLVKSDTSKIKYTMVVASYRDTTDENGGTISQLIDISYVPVSIDENQRVLKKYATQAVDCTDATKVKAFIWDYPSFKNIYSYEQEL